MITISTDPKHLISVCTTHKHMLWRLIEHTIYKKVEDVEFGPKRSHLIAFIGFRMVEWADKYEERKPLPWKSFVIHVGSNYFSVYSKEAPAEEFVPTGFNFDNWKFEGSHDSCWGTSIDNFLWEHQGEIDGFAWGHDPIEWKTLSDQQLKKLQELKRKAREEREKPEKVV